MPKKTLKSIVPSPARMREIQSLRVLGDWIYATNLWHINRYSASMAFFVGLFVAFMPVPGQMVLAALLAILLSCNLPLSVGLVWITNPLTMPAIFYMAYKVGALLIDVPVKDVQFELSFHWLTNSLSAIRKPFLLGLTGPGGAPGPGPGRQHVSPGKRRRPGTFRRRRPRPGGCLPVTGRLAGTTPGRRRC